MSNDQINQMMLAIRYGQIHKIKYLFEEERFPLNYKDTSSGRSILRYAFMSRKINVIEQMLKCGVHPHFQGLNGCMSEITCLSVYFSSEDHGIILDMMISFGYDVNKIYKNFYGSETCPLLDVFKIGDSHLFMKLLERNADPTIYLNLPEQHKISSKTLIRQRLDDYIKNCNHKSTSYEEIEMYISNHNHKRITLFELCLKIV